MQENTNTVKSYHEVIDRAKNVFLKKTQDYGTSWRVLRPISVVDQIFIKARRIRNLQEGILPLVADDISTELVGIINYGIIGLMQMHLQHDDMEDLPVNAVNALYDNFVANTLSLMQQKNNDYGEAWRAMSEESFADLILMKLNRMKQIIRNEGKTLISEGLDANYMDIINYAVFALILKQAKPEVTF